MMLLLICILLLSYSLGSIYTNTYMVVLLFNAVIYVVYCYIYVFLFYVYISSFCQVAHFGYPDRFYVLFPQL